jgi:hypothetical protein
MRKIAAIISSVILLLVAQAESAHAVIPVLVDGAPTLEVPANLSLTQDALHYLEVASDWVDSLNNDLTRINQFATYLELFGNPGDVLNLVGLDGVMGGDGGSVLSSLGTLGGNLFKTYDQVQSLASKGMDLYSVGGRVAGGDWQTAMRAVGMSNVVPLAQASAVFGAQNASLDGATNYVRQAQAALAGVKGSVNQARRAKTDAEVAKASAASTAQIATAQQAMSQASLDQQVVANQFASQQAMQGYLASAERNARVRADNKAGFFAPAADIEMPNMPGGTLSGGSTAGTGGGTQGTAGNGPLSNAIASRIGESTAGIAGTDGGNLACAWVVNSVFEQATGSPIATGGDRLSVLGTVAAIEAQPDRFREVSRAEALASGGDYIIASNPEWGSNGSHIGIGNGSTIWSNSSSQAAIEQNFTSGSWSNYYGEARYFIALK